VILGGGVAVCLLLSAHRAVIFAIAQLSCLFITPPPVAERSRPFVMSMSVCLSVRISQEQHVQTSPSFNFSVHVVPRSFSTSIRYKLPVLWITAYLHRMARNRRHELQGKYILKMHGLPGEASDRGHSLMSAISLLNVNVQLFRLMQADCTSSS